uniref:Major facilitator superfamily protein n=1 Tax=Flammulina velutipes TaxID=38945 RepID=A0A2R3STX2_FLAVE|nr:major facilitator superfamily protein [Flammulina velutipes]
MALPSITPQPDSDSREGTIVDVPTDCIPSAPSQKIKEVQLTDQTHVLPFKKIISVFLGLGLCVFVTALDSVIIATSLPTINTTFHAGAVVSWVPSAYMLTSAAFQPIYGRFSDIFGRKTALALAMSIFMFGNLLAGFSKKIIQVIIFRGIAGAGGGGIVSMMQIVVSDVVTLRDRGKYQGIIQAIVAVGYTAGPLIGGALSESVGWRWSFWVTIPISLVATVIVWFVLPLKPVEPGIRRKLLCIDYIGSALTLAASTLIMLPLIWGGVTFPWSSPIVLGSLSAGFFLILVFCLWEWKGARLPIIPMYIFKHMTVTGVYIIMFINGFVFFSSLYYLPQYFQVVLEYSPIDAAMFLIPLLLGQMSASWVAGIIISKTGKYTPIIHSGFSVWAVGCGFISTVNPATSKAAMVIFMLLSGIGAGQTLQPTTIAAQASVPRRDMSVVTAFRNFVRQIGGTLALAVNAALINNQLRASMENLSLSESIVSAIIDDPAYLYDNELNLRKSTRDYILVHGYTKGFQYVFYLNAGLTALAVFVSIMMIKHKDLNTDFEERERLKEAQDEERKRDVEMGGRKDNSLDTEQGPNQSVEAR